MIKDSIHALQHTSAIDAEGQVTPRLEPTKGHAIAQVREANVIGIDGADSITDPELDDGELIARCLAGEDVATLRTVVGGAGDGVVDGFAGGVVDHGEGGARVHDGGLAGQGDFGAFDGGFLGL